MLTSDSATEARAALGNSGIMLDRGESRAQKVHAQLQAALDKPKCKEFYKIIDGKLADWRILWKTRIAI